VDEIDKKPSNAISEYERTKHKNITQNKKLLMQAANEAGLGKFLDDSTRVDTKKRSSKKKGETGQKAAEPARCQREINFHLGFTGLVQLRDGLFQLFLGEDVRS